MSVRCIRHEKWYKFVPPAASARTAGIGDDGSTGRGGGGEASLRAPFLCLFLRRHENLDSAKADFFCHEGNQSSWFGVGVVKQRL